MLLGPLGWGSGVDSCQTCVNQSLVIVWGFHVIHCLWVFVFLGLGVHVRDQALYQDQFPEALSWRQINKSPRLPEVTIHTSATPIPTPSMAPQTMRKSCRGSHPGHSPVNLAYSLISVGQVDLVRMIGTLGSLLGASVVKHSMGTMWPLFQLILLSIH